MVRQDATEAAFDCRQENAMASGGDEIVFNQQNQQVGTQTNIGKAEGGVSIDARGLTPERVRGIQAATAEIEDMPGLPSELSRGAGEALKLAEAAKPSPENAPLKDKLDSAGRSLEAYAKTLESADGLAEKVVKAAQSLFKIGKWMVDVTS
jgi:hypothetical protein